MRIKEVGYVVERLADRFRDLGGQMAAQEAAHKTALEELRAGFNARIASDKHRLENLREEIIRLNEAHGRTMVERDALRAEVAALQERLRASIARSDFAQMEVAALKSQTPKQHPVKAGEWLRKTTDGLMYKAGERFRLTSYEIIDGKIWCNLENGASWLMSVCEPCDPPAETTQWVEEMRGNTEATHDTPEGKAAAESVIRDSRKTETADEIKVGDDVEVFQSSSPWTFTDDVGTSGTITCIETDPVSRTEIVHLREHPEDAFALCDVRKVTP